MKIFPVLTNELNIGNRQVLKTCQSLRYRDEFSRIFRVAAGRPVSDEVYQFAHFSSAVTGQGSDGWRNDFPEASRGNRTFSRRLSETKRNALYLPCGPA
jgi:hypothetical protein